MEPDGSARFLPQRKPPAEIHEPLRSPCLINAGFRGQRNTGAAETVAIVEDQVIAAEDGQAVLSPAVGFLAATLLPKKQRDLTNLTVWQQDGTPLE